VRAVVAAFSFLTRLPVSGGPIRDADFGRSVVLFPVVGLVLGLVLTGVALVAAPLPPLLGGVAVIAVLAGLTGGMHLDGFADVFDAVGGGQGDRTRMLAIMRDSRIGAHGAAALALLLIAKVVAVGALIQRRDLVGLLAFPTIGRWTVAPLMAFFPYAREEGLGRAFSGQVGARQVAVAGALTVLVAAALGLRLLLPALASTLVVLMFALWMHRRLGGMTGDVYGAAIELGELGVLTALCL
jgi:adenosylcobinamide-GDP ribazoletransferase